MSNPGSSEGPLPPLSIVDLIDKAEASLAKNLHEQMHDQVILSSFAQLWRTGIAGLAGLPAELRGPQLASPEFRRGGASWPGGLGDDYPSGLLEFIRATWITAARAMAMQQAMLPFGFDESRRLHELASRLERVPTPSFAPTPSRVVHATADFRLRQIAPDEPAEGEPILIVSSLINRWYILDFHASQSFVAMVRGLGRPVYLLEWLPPRQGDQRSLGDLCAGPVREAVDHLRQRHAVPAVAVIGYSMGGTIATCLASRYPERVSRLATVCAPIRFDLGGSFSRWLSPEFVNVDQVTSTWPRVPAQLVHLPFWWLRPTIKLHKMTLIARSFERPGYIDQFLATEVWNHDNVDLSIGVFRSWVGDLYQNNDLMHGKMIVDGEAIHPRHIRCPVLVISGASDNIAPPQAAEGLVELCEPGAVRLLRLDSGHVGVLSSRRALAAEAVELKEWLAAPSSPSPVAQEKTS
jgi:polyhydroxyalkanoate synthase